MDSCDSVGAVILNGPGWILNADGSASRPYQNFKLGRPLLSIPRASGQTTSRDAVLRMGGGRSEGAKSGLPSFVTSVGPRSAGAIPPRLYG